MTHILKCLSITPLDAGGYELTFDVDGAISVLTIPPQTDILEYKNLLTTHDVAQRLMLASWLGVDPTAQDFTKLTEFEIELDFEQLQSVKRVVRLTE